MKLPAPRVEELAATARATPSEAGRKRAHRDWAVVEPGDDLALAEEACRFVKGLSD